MVWGGAILVLLTLATPISTANQEYADNGTHWVVLPDNIVPGKPLAITFSFFNTTEDVDVQVDLLEYDHNSLATVEHTFVNAFPGVLQIPVPGHLSHTGSYSVLIHGLKGVFFNIHARLNYDQGYIPQRFAVQIQLDKAVYKPGQTIHFRTFGVYSDMMVYDGRFDVRIQDPKGNIMKQLHNVTTGAYGVLEDLMIMDDEPVMGTWTIICTTYSHYRNHSYYSQMTKSKTFQIDKYVLPKFTVDIQLPSYVITTDKEMSGTVAAVYTYGKPVLGTAVVRADISYRDSPWKYNGDEVMVETTLDLEGDVKFTIPFDQITHEVDPNSYTPLVEKLAGFSLIVTVSVTESLNNITRNASSSVRFYKEPYRISFIDETSYTFFKPGLPYVGHIYLTQADGRPVISDTKDVVLRSYVKFYDAGHGKYRAQTLPDKTFAPPPTGVLEFEVDPPNNAYSLHLEVEYKGLTDTFDMNKPSWMIEEGNLQLTQKSDSYIGQEVVFNLQTALPLDSVFYSIINNGHLLSTGMLQANGSLSENITFQVTYDMKPYSKLLVYYFTTDGWNADSIYFNAESSADVFNNKVGISFDRSSAEPGENVSLQITTDPMSLINLLAVDQSVLLLGTGNDVTQTDVITSLRPDDHPSQDSHSLHNPISILQSSGIQLYSDVVGFTSWTHHNSRRQIDCDNLYYPTTTSFYPYFTSTNASRPSLNAGETAEGQSSGLKPVTRTREKFPETWLWTNIISGSNGSAVITATVPDTITSWFASAFSVNQHTGLGIVDQATKFTTFRPFFISLNLPYSVIRGEHLVLQINVFNYMGQDLDVVITLEQSDDFRAIVNDSGHVTYETKEIVRPLKIIAGNAASVFIPIVPEVVGTAEISVKAQSALSVDAVKRQLKVEAEGNPMHFNVPLLLSENNPTDVPLSLPDNFVPDSQKVQVSAIGDIMGPTTKNLKSLLRMPTGCGEQTMTALAPDVFVYNYLKNTNQLTPEIAEMAIRYMTQGYQRELAFQRYDGSFSIWGPSDYQGSTWLTAFVLKSFAQVKKHIFVSDNVLYQAANWITRYQNNDGSFQSIGAVHSTSLRGGATSTYSLTSFVLIALLESEQYTKSFSSHLSNSAFRARAYLENHINNITDAYDLAITAYALAKAGSVGSFTAYSALNLKATTTKDGKKYWKVEGPSHPQQYWQTFYAKESPLSVEVSAYSLLYLVETKQLSEGLPVMKWLVSQRNSLGGFTSTQDTVLGLQALSEFGYQTTADLDLDIDINAVNFSRTINVAKSDAMVLKLTDLPLDSIQAPIVHGSGSQSTATPPPMVSLEAAGQGAALVQVSVSFNVESEPSHPAFNLTADIDRESLSSIVVKACAKYELAYYRGPGMCVIELDIPTGFEADLEGRFSDLYNVKKSEIRNTKTVVLYYDELSPLSPTCAYIEMVRSDLVANTKPSAVRVYDYYEPESFKALTFYQSTLLQSSSICDLCTDCGC